MILQEDGYNVDMVETKRLAEAKALIERYHSCEREKDVTSTVTHELIRDRKKLRLPRAKSNSYD